MKMAMLHSTEAVINTLFHLDVSRFITTSCAIGSLVMLKDELLSILDPLSTARAGRPRLIGVVNFLALDRRRSCLEDLLRLRTLAVERSLAVL